MSAEGAAGPGHAMARDGRVNRAAVLAAAMMGVVLVTVDVSAVNVAAPALGRSFRTDVGGMEWVLNIYTLAYAAFLLNAGALGDRHGPRATFLTGFALFTLASLGCGLAPAYGWLLAARLMQGLGAALLVPSALALLRLAYPDGRAHSHAIGWWAGAGSFALAGGPVLAGALIALVGWRGIFLINLPVGVAGLWLTAAHAPASTRSAAGRMDWPGQIAAVAALGALAASVTQAGGLGWTSRWVVGGLVAACVASAAFLVIERRSPHPMAPPAIFRDPVFTTSVAVGFAINVAFYGLVFVLSLFFQHVQGRTALEAGLAFAPLTAILLVVNVAAGRLNARLGLRRTLVAGLCLAAAGDLALIPTRAATPLAALTPALLMIGVGIAMATPAMVAAAIASAHVGRSGIGSGVLNAARQIGGALGVALFGSLVGGADFLAGFRLVLALAAAALLAAGAAAFLAIPPHPARNHP